MTNTDLLLLGKLHFMNLLRTNLNFMHIYPIHQIIEFKIDLRLLSRHKNRDIDICAGEIASLYEDNKIIDDEG